MIIRNSISPAGYERSECTMYKSIYIYIYEGMRHFCLIGCLTVNTHLTAAPEEMSGIRNLTFLNCNQNSRFSI